MIFLQNKKKTILLYVGVLAVLLVGVLVMSTMIKPAGVTYKYSDIVYMFEEGSVKQFSLNLGTGELKLKLDSNHAKTASYKETNKDKDGNKYIVYNVGYAQKFLDDTKPAIEKYNKGKTDANKLQFELIPAKDRSWLLTVIPMLVSLLLVGFLFFVMMRQSNGGGKINQFSKANAKTIQSGKKTTFAEVAGADEEKEELYEIVEFLKRPDKFNELGARIPKGVLLVGPPGTGKTLLARAVAGEAGVPFYSISGSDFVEMFVGVGASRVRDLFTTAKKNSPSIIFIDEIDAVGRHRGAGLGGGHDEREQTLNQLLVEMDGFGANEGVIIIAATNRRDILDPALLRPGRFDRQVVVGYPDVKGREEILKVHARNKPLGFDVDLNKIARTTAGFTGADLENLLNEAALLAARNHRKAITEKDIEAATIKVVAGPEKKSHKISDHDKKITSYHEAGHAVATYYCKTQDSVHEVSIIPRGMAAGYTMHLPTEDRMHMSKMKMQESLTVLLAGRVAEEICLDDICTGASNDIERATQTARDMVTRYGFSNTLGPIVYGQPEGEVFLGRELNHQRNYSENVAKEIDAEIRTLIDNAYESARDILTAHREQLELVTKWLLEYEKIDSTTFEKLMKGELEFTPSAEKIEKPKEETVDKKEEKKEGNPLDVISPEVEDFMKSKDEPHVE
ncbi:ATP-dependent zinc metalloprotease FtsH [Paludicola sp. MB14-C6]|uniref:ATP-dependent zinc metalloprotease FtsH n=1 Tax=Paludihabitans sp. MB14-C6 TaxID=3070656 RepID=UPI0027DB2B85|nr:ATP-dependent zinc metalloprotease FtsH [Paludicola sp. MB14-C6]WMJ24127.1 ATP-dependent zinc metalloprotease FtsH [Paludicola sp. MB14-C6]